MDNNRKNILIVDDNEINRMILSEMLKGEFTVYEAVDGLEAVNFLKEKADDVTLILLDIVMPNLDGFGVLAAMNTNHWIEKIPVIIISSEASTPVMQKAYDLGAVDYISRPFDTLLLHKRILNTIMVYGKQKDLEELVASQIAQRERESKLMISILAHIVESRNGESGKHVKNINCITEILLKQLLGMTDKYNDVSGDIGIITLASTLHDIGKVGIPEAILNKPGKLTVAEYTIIKSHAMMGAELIQDIDDIQDEPLSKYSYQIARWHHERFDGQGYPDGLKGDDIPIAAQVVSLADVYDALTQERCYKKAFSHEVAIQMILNGECGQFNPLLIECLLRVEETLKKEFASDSKTSTQ